LQRSLASFEVKGAQFGVTVCLTSVYAYAATPSILAPEKRKIENGIMMYLAKQNVHSTQSEKVNTDRFELI